MLGRGEPPRREARAYRCCGRDFQPIDRGPLDQRASGLIISITGGRDLMLFESMKLRPAFAKRPIRCQHHRRRVLR